MNARRVRERCIMLICLRPRTWNMSRLYIPTLWLSSGLHEQRLRTGMVRAIPSSWRACASPSTTTYTPRTLKRMHYGGWNKGFLTVFTISHIERALLASEKAYGRIQISSLCFTYMLHRINSSNISLVMVPALLFGRNMRKPSTAPYLVCTYNKARRPFLLFDFLIDTDTVRTPTSSKIQLIIHKQEFKHSWVKTHKFRTDPEICPSYQGATLCT